MNNGQDYIAMIKHSVQASCHSMDSFEEFISNGTLKKSYLFLKTEERKAKGKQMRMKMLLEIGHRILRCIPFLIRKPPFP